MAVLPDPSLFETQSVEAAQTVDRFLAEHPDYPPRLRGKVLQAADDLVRASRILGK